MLKMIVKKVFQITIIISLVTGSVAYASTNDKGQLNYLEESIYDIRTNEEIIPIIKNGSRNTTEVINKVEDWKISTKHILEKAYKQKIINIQEDDDYITFEYDYDDSIIEPQLSKTEYLKPSSNLANTSIPTKMNYAWAWSNYFKGGSKSGRWGVTKTLLIAVPGLSSKTVLNIFSVMLGVLDSSLAASTPVTCETSVKYYYLNKIGYVQDSNFGYWLPYAYVGSQRGFNRYIGIKKDSYGQPVKTWVNEKTGKPSNNPTNQDFINKKSNFDNNTWILNKAISQYKNDAGVYSNIFGLGTNITPTLP